MVDNIYQNISGMNIECQYDRLVSLLVYNTFDHINLNFYVEILDTDSMDQSVHMTRQ